MSIQDLKDLILGWIPDNVMRLISPQRARNAYNSIIDFFWDVTGDKLDLETTDKSSLVNAINEVRQTGGFVITEVILTNGQSFLFPAMSKGEAFVIRIIENNTPSQDGMVWLGGYDGVSVGNDTLVICVYNSVGGSYSNVGHQFVIINQGKDSEVIFVDELPDEHLARTGVIYVLNSNNAMYIWDSQLGDYVLIGDVIPGTLISSTEFRDESNNVVIPEANKLYFDTTTEDYYRWDGSGYVPIVGSGATPTLAEVLAEGNIADTDIEFIDHNFPPNSIGSIGVPSMLSHNSISLKRTVGSYNFEISPEAWVFNFDDGSNNYIDSLQYGNRGFRIDSTDPSNFKGLVGTSYFGANYDNNTYVQKKYVDDADDNLQQQINNLVLAVDAGLKTPEPIDCSTNPNYPTSEAGDTYKVTVAGKIGGASGEAVEVGDLIICTTDSAGGTQAQVGQHFFIVQANIDQATETVVGFAKIATQNQTAAGTNDDTIVTPKKLQKKLDDFEIEQEQTSDGKYVRYDNNTQGLTNLQKSNARTNIGAADDSTVVKRSGNQTVAGTKTFSAYPVLPTAMPTTDRQAAPKKYVDDQIAAAALEWTTEDW